MTIKPRAIWQEPQPMSYSTREIRLTLNGQDAYPLAPKLPGPR